MRLSGRNVFLFHFFPSVIDALYEIVTCEFHAGGPGTHVEYLHLVVLEEHGCGCGLACEPNDYPVGAVIPLAVVDLLVPDEGYELVSDLR